jgi:nicotinate-nucleotide--dimethylbenzimidazole phosphoribosyltransferase
MQHRSTMNDRTSLSRMTRAALLALALGCAPALQAQDAATPAPAPRALPGVADIDFSLRGREVETPGTPTEGPVRPSAAPAPSGPAPAPQASPTPPAARSAGAGGDVARPRAAQAGAPSPAPDAASLPATDAPLVQTPELEAAPEGVPEQGATEAAAAPSPAIEQSPSGFPAWPFGLAVLAAALWFALRRRKPAKAAIADRVAEPAQPVAAEPPDTPVPALVSDPVPAAHPALRVRLAAPVEEPAEPAPVRAAPQPVVPAPAAITRYDAFGRPIAGPPVAPKPPPPPPPKPRARIVRYDAMGLPILD